MKFQKFDLEHKPCGWWIRSAFSKNSYNVGYVVNNDYIGFSDAYFDYGLLPTCIII